MKHGPLRVSAETGVNYKSFSLSVLSTIVARKVRSHLGRESDRDGVQFRLGWRLILGGTTASTDSVCILRGEAIVKMERQ